MCEELRIAFISRKEGIVLSVGIVELAILLVGVIIIVAVVKKNKGKDVQTSIGSGNNESAVNTKQEYRFRCNVCGKVFCYTQEEYEHNEGLKKAAQIASFASGFQSGLGSSYRAHEAGKKADRINDRIKDYSKCPNCNSSDVVRVSNDEKHIAVNKDADAPTALEQLAKLHEKGIITDEEFQQKKIELLAKM